jgi:hypothetical protein
VISFRSPVVGKWKRLDAGSMYRDLRRGSIQSLGIDREIFHVVWVHLVYEQHDSVAENRLDIHTYNIRANARVSGP